MSPDQLHKTTAFMMNAWENMKMQTHGKCSPIYSTTYRSQPSCKDKYLELMEDCLLILLVLMTSENLIEFKKYPMKEQFVTCCGVIQIKDLGLTWVQEVQDGHLAR